VTKREDEMLAWWLELNEPIGRFKRWSDAISRGIRCRRYVWCGFLKRLYSTIPDKERPKYKARYDVMNMLCLNSNREDYATPGSECVNEDSLPWKGVKL